jgi:hypothetical protein
MVALPKHRDLATVEAVYAALEQAADDGLRPHLGFSVVGRECVRAIWYSFRWATSGRHDGRLLRLFRRGKLEEEQVVADLRAAGVTVVTDDGHGNQWSFLDLGGHFAGSMDGAVLGLHEAPKTWHVLEVKTANGKRFASLVKNGLQKGEPRHWVQVQLYMHYSAMERGYYVCVSKEDDSIYAERVHYEQEVALTYRARAEAAVFSPRPLPRINESPAFHICKWCEHRGVCHEGLPVLTNCRTCRNSVPEPAGGWTCGLHHCALSDADQRRGCNDYRVIEGLEAREQENIEQLMKVFGARVVESVAAAEGDPDDPLPEFI